MQELLRVTLASLNTRQQVLLMGYAVPMPVTVRTRLYDESFYQTVTRGRHVKELPDLGVSDVWGE